MADPIDTHRLQWAADLANLRAKISDVINPLLDGKPFALVDFPDHSNVGDSAIWLGETAFFAGNGLKPAYCSSLKSHSSAEMKTVIGDGTIFLHGGGNFGTIWKAHQDFRIELLNAFPGQRIIQLPQSIHFETFETVGETAAAIERHGRFTLLVRDQPSLEFARLHLHCEVTLCPDMAFYMGTLKRQKPAHDIFYLLRTDLEGAVTGSARHSGLSFEVDDWLEESRLSIRMASAIARASSLTLSANAARFVKYDRLARTRLQRGINMLSSGRVVVTDRLHGHIMSTLLGIPHVALDNNYGKLQNFIGAWTKDMEFLRTARTLEEAAVLAESLLT
jgi:exopolysaccharide biosynthesis predicted pyruvyltransferase EpsI